MSRKLLNLCTAALLSVVSTAAWALSEVNGVYQIGTAEDLVAFAELVNGDNPYAHAVLTADIEKPATDVSMIGRDGQDFQGTFDGQGHTITIDMYSQSENGTALFRNIGVHGIVQNLKVQGKITTDKKFAAGIAAWSSGIIRGCYIDVEVTSAVTGDATHGGIIGVANRGTLIENCLAKFVVKGATTQNCGGLIGWCDNPVNMVNNLVISDGSTLDTSNSGSANIARNGGNVRVPDLAQYNADPYANRPAGANYNNYVTNQWGANNATTVVSYDDLADGRICYQLNNDQSHIGWVQRIGTDPFPVPAAFGSGQVYASGTTDCDGKSEGELTFSNSGSDQATKHQFDKYGMCPVCGCFNFHAFEFDDASKFDQADRTVLLNSADDIYTCEGWNRVADGFKLNMKMVNDIEVAAPSGELIFNDANWVDGDFNGQGHQLTIGMADITVNNASFIPKITGTFENVIMHGTISSSGQFAASVTSHTYSDKVIIRNVFSDIDFNLSHDGDNTSAGIIGVSESKTRVENVIYTGNINGVEGGNTQCLAGFCGWATGQTYFTNCAFVGTLNNAVGDSRNVSRNPGNVTSENVWFIEDFGFSDTDKFNLFEGGEEGVESGQLAYYLNGMQGGLDRFYQKIGQDMFPMPIKKEGALVYANAPEYRCDGQPLGKTTYSNTPTADPVIPDHNFIEGFCTVCESLQEDYLTPVDGWFEISNGAELLWWSHYAAKHLDASAKLTADIDMDGYSERWASVGTEGAPFYGNFDGQFHIISNLNVDMPEANGVGLIGVMNSLPSKGFGGISDADARAAEGVYIKDVVLDETCSLLGRGYIGLVGMTAPWAGHVNIKGVMMCGDVTANGGPNASGVFGCVMSSTCHVTIDNCGMVGNVYGAKENGSFSGWLGSYAEVTNCFAVGSVEGIEDDDHYFARYNSATFTNCYARYGTQVPTVSEEDFASGALAWRANGNQFRTSYWYQTIGDDMYPFPDPSHGTVIFAADQYFSVASEAELSDVAEAVQDYEEKAMEETIATQSLLDELTNAIEALSAAKTTLEFADALDVLEVKKAAVAENAAVYMAYMAKCSDVRAYLEGNTDFEGAIREALEAYLDESNYEEPSDENPLGSYDYIITNHTASAEDIKAETERVALWLESAIAGGYVPGTDISNLIPNYDFSKQKESWTNAWCTGYGQIKDENGKTVRGVEAWNVTGDMYQTVEDMKPGYYLVGINGAFRPSNNRYSTNYAAGIYANGIFNYFPTVIEDIVKVDEAIDQVNCNLEGAGAHDLAIYDDGYSTNDENGGTVIGYAVHGETGMACAANVGRYQVYTIAKVGEDGKLTIGIKNPGTKYSNDWTGWGALKVVYCGDDEEKSGEALDQVLKNMVARATTLIEHVPDAETAAADPNFPEALKSELQEYVDAVYTAETVEEKAELAAKFSDIFQRIYEGKQAYIALFNAGDVLLSIETDNLPLVEWVTDDAGENGEWLETGNFVFSNDETSALLEAGYAFHDAYDAGECSTAVALEAAALTDPSLTGIIPAKDEDGFYLIGTPRDLVAFRAISINVDNTVKGKLTADIDMTGIGMQPINTKDNRFRGTLDGQAYAISNLYINHPDANTGLFGGIDAATVKNLKVTGKYYSDNKFIGGITGYTYGNCVIENCDVAVEIYSTVSGDGTHGGLIGVNETAGTVINNCIINCPMFGESTDHCGGVIGWSTEASTVKNTLILSEGHTVGANESNTVSRNPDNCTVSNVFYVEQFGTAAGTKVTAEQLASGEITYKLNGSQSEDVVWFQTLGTDATPRLFEGATIYYYGGRYINEQPNPQLNAFAYNLKAKPANNNVVVSFALNAEAAAAEIRFFNGEQLIYTESVPAEALRPGTHEVTVDGSKLSGDLTALKYEIAVTGKGSLDVLQMGDSYKFNSPYGLEVNNNPASKGFGQVLVTETRPTEDRDGMFSTGTPGALFAFDAAFEPVGSYYGGLDIADETPLKLFGEYELDLKDLRFSKDGRLFVARASGTSNSSVYEINPDNLAQDWKPVFTGGELDEQTGITYVGDDEQNRPAVGLALESEGDDLKMYVLGVQGGVEEAAPTAFNCAVYDLGTATTWTAAPSRYFEPLCGAYAAIPTHVGIHEDRQGGIWFIQSAGTHSEEIPSIKHFDRDGNVDYTNFTTDTHSGKMAITTDGMYLAIPQGNNKVVIYETNYVPMANGSIYLDPKYNIATTESSVTGLAFDYANNLYVASSGSKTLSRYVIPSWNNNVVVTPGNGIGESGDINGDGNTDIADVVAILSVMAQLQNFDGADVNGDGTVDIADVVAVLTIMAQQ